MKVCLACSHGGHLDELLQLSQVWGEHERIYITYPGFAARNLDKVFLVANWARQPWMLIPVFWRVLMTIMQERPSVIVSTGAEIALPVFIAGWLLGIPRVFIESYCRVHSPSTTGKFVYYISSLFLVQWPEMLEVYGPKATFWGGVY
jgi:UDP-N-acetylglucosamine:LPS N-acetylglucosamine transferase